MRDYDLIPADEIPAIMANRYAPKSLAGRMELANQLLAPLRVDPETGEEYVGPPMIDTAGYLAIIEGDPNARP